MRDWLVETDIAAVAVMLACCLKLLQRFTSDRWQQRFAAMGSPLMKPPAYRVLFLLVLIGVVLVSVLPEAAFMLTAVDAVGLEGTGVVRLVGPAGHGRDFAASGTGHVVHGGLSPS